MKRILFTTFLLYLFVFVIQAQEQRFIFNEENQTEQDKTRTTTEPPTQEELKLDSLNKVPPAIPSWKIDPLLGERIPTPMDTVLTGFNNKSLVDGQDVAVGYLGNWGAPAQSKIFFDQQDPSAFIFLDAFNFYYTKPGDQLYLNTKQPYSNIMYQSGGSRQSKEERFTGKISLSFNKYLNVGFYIDYSYARGYYQYLANKQLNTNAFISYTGEKYQMHILVGTNAYNNSENGGITDPRYLSGSVPEDLVNKNNTLDFPVNLDQTWNKLYGTQIYMANRYNVGFKSTDNSTDSIPMATFIFTTHYQDQRRKFYSNDMQGLDQFYNYTGENSSGVNQNVNDRMSFWSFKNTLGVVINEGFRDWAKFGLTAYIQQDLRRYTLPAQRNPWTFLQDPFSQNSTFIGGILSKEKGKYLRYNLAAEFGVLGYNLGESKLKADVSTTLNFKDRELIVKANGYIKNLKPTFYQNHFNSKYFNWNKDFSDTRRVFVGGEIYVPSTRTRLSGGVENIQNMIYLSDSITTPITYNNPDNHGGINIRQEGGSVQVVSLRLDQNLTFGFFNWNNQVVFQTSSNEDVLPLPKISLYTNAYVQFMVAKVLKVQLGVDAHYFTKYYSPGYDPALLQFYNQKRTKIGNFPFTNAYVNLHLKKTRFFLMMYNILRNTDDSQYLTLPNYPVDPMIFKFGLSWNFTN